MTEHIEAGPPQAATVETEWSVAFTGYRSLVWHGDKTAEQAARNHARKTGGRVQRRTVTTTAWEDAPDEH